MKATLALTALVTRSPGWPVTWLYRRSQCVDEEFEVARLGFMGVERLHRGRQSPAALMPEHHQQRRIELSYTEFQAADHGTVQHLPCTADDDEVADSTVEDQFDGDAGVDAAQNGRKWFLGAGDRHPPRHIVVEVFGVILRESLVAVAQQLQSLIRIGGQRLDRRPGGRIRRGSGGQWRRC